MPPLVSYSTGHVRWVMHAHEVTGCYLMSRQCVRVLETQQCFSGTRQVLGVREWRRLRSQINQELYNIITSGCVLSRIYWAYSFHRQRNEHNACNQKRSDGGYIGIYTPAPKSVYFKFFVWLFCLLDPGQIQYRAIYTHPNQIPGYASACNASKNSCLTILRFSTGVARAPALRN